MKNFFLASLFFLIISSFFYFEYQKLFPHDYKITFLDVQLGDAVLIQTPQGKTILIDTSNDEGVLFKLSKHLSFFDKTIDILVLTHGDLDHIGGAPAILNRYQVKQIFWHGAEKKHSSVFAEIKQIIATQKISYRVLDESRDFSLDKNILWDTIFPLENISYLTDHGNDESLSFLLSILGRKILITGDIESTVEKIILKQGENLKSDILKVAHHGSKTSSINSFIKAVSPRWAVAQAALDNKFNHPHTEIVDKFKQNNVQFLQTGIEGDIQFCINQENPVFVRCK
jgi:competence protein ComEC